MIRLHELDANSQATPSRALSTRMRISSLVDFAVLAASICLLVAPFDTARAAEVVHPFNWKLEKTTVFAVGLLEWKHPEIYSSFPDQQANRADVRLVNHFRKIGIPEERIVFLKDSAATKAHILEELRKVLAASKPGDLLIFYFAGHGSRDEETGSTYFANYDAGEEDSSAWNVASIFKTIQNKFRGDRAVMIADCCHSGALYDEAGRHAAGRVSFACLTSSYSHNLSTGNWTFTDSLLQAFRGTPAADSNADSVVQLHEAARYIELEMAFIEGQKSMFITTGEFPSDSPVARVKTIPKPGTGRRVEALSEGKWYKAKIIDAETGRSKVHYTNYGEEYDEWLPTDRIREYVPKVYAVDTKVQVYSEDDKKWEKGTILKTWYGLHYIHFDGYDASWDEWVGPNAIKPR
ncbi:MAG: caspase family protein [Planctomycetia bacterium]|nr:caspase family protein [Planctomycetia bacterium]